MNVIDQTYVRPVVLNDFEKVVKLIQSENLPTEDISNDLSHFFVIESSEIL